ncbi:TetR-like C-terminal domain-containing protein [Actinocorallia populi]|uniref:TetR-like C-terminal domain-containing protein n=1 Tax=Actinocorallia populi TaxID=2079200 RepID=UPI0013005317|nr:TetR-like C-terminal domain-containing protein [Actinocorallia populi]
MTLTESDLSRRLDEIHAAALGVFHDISDRRPTHEEVAALADVDCAALRRRWPLLDELLVEALAALLPPPEDPGDLGGLRAELRPLVVHLAREYSEHGELLVRTTARLPASPALDRAFRQRFLYPRVECVRHIFGRAVLRGELRPDADPRLVFSLVPALLSYRTMLRDPAPEPSLADRLLDTVLLPLLLLR